jgi:predicted transcriptional regulator
MRRKSIDDLGELQRAIMETVWELGEATVAQVRQRLASRKELAYTTVLSVMQKLEKAGWLRHRAEGKTYRYMPRKTRREVGAMSLRRFMDRVFHGDPMALFQHMLEDQSLSQEDLTALRHMIDRRKKELRDE